MREIYWFVSMMSGLIGFGAIEAHLVNRRGYLFAFTLGVFESAIGAVVVVILTYLACLLVRFVVDLLITLRDRLRGPNLGG
jgi:hypothetical protein